MRQGTMQQPLNDGIIHGTVEAVHTSVAGSCRAAFISASGLFCAQGVSEKARRRSTILKRWNMTFASVQIYTVTGTILQISEGNAQGPVWQVTDVMSSRVSFPDRN